MAFGSAERRSAPRQQVRHDAAIVNPWGAPVLCRITDTSAQGARLEAPDAPAGDNFELIDLTSGFAYQAVVAWRHHPHIGVRFSKTWRLSNHDTPAWLKAAAAKASRGKAR